MAQAYNSAPLSDLEELGSIIRGNRVIVAHTLKMQKETLATAQALADKLDRLTAKVEEEQPGSPSLPPLVSNEDV